MDEIEKKQYDVVYSEREFYITIADFHDDFCTIRREMIAFKIFTMENNYYTLVKDEK